MTTPTSFPHTYNKSTIDELAVENGMDRLPSSATKTPETRRLVHRGDVRDGGAANYGVINAHDQIILGEHLCRPS